MSDKSIIEDEMPEPVLDPINRVTEIFFGMFMALTFVGAISVANAGREEIRTMFAAALACNLAWGLVDAAMYLVGIVTNRGKSITLALAVRSASDAETGRKLIERALPRAVAGLISTTEVEAIRGRLVALPSIPLRPTLRWEDLLAAIWIFLIVAIATFPVVLPFLWIKDVETAKTASRAIALAILFFGGLSLGHYAGYGSWKVGLIMVGLGTGLVLAIRALGG